MQKGLGSIISVAIAESAPSVGRAMEWHIPPVVMESFQCLAWLSAFIIAVIAVFKYNKQTKK